MPEFQRSVELSSVPGKSPPPPARFHESPSQIAAVVCPVRTAEFKNVKLTLPVLEIYTSLPAVAFVGEGNVIV